jgi:hypothetical protein
MEFEAVEREVEGEPEETAEVVETSKAGSKS